MRFADLSGFGDIADFDLIELVVYPRKNLKNKNIIFSLAPPMTVLKMVSSDQATLTNKINGVHDRAYLI